MATSSGGDTVVLDKISELKAFQPEAKGLHQTIMRCAPDLVPRLWYGMPGYAKTKRGPVVVFFRVDDEDYVTFGLTEKANLALDDDASDQLRPSAWFLTALDDATEARIEAIVKKAVA